MQEVAVNLSAMVRLDNNKHLIKLIQLRGVCMLCKNRSQLKYTGCDFALHPGCCYKHHVPSEEQEKIIYLNLNIKGVFSVLSVHTGIVLRNL